MSKKIGATLAQAILAMQKDPSKLAIELKVHVFPCPNGVDHTHFTVSSPFAQLPSRLLKDALTYKAHLQKVRPVYGDYIFRQSLTDGTKCVNEKTSDAATVEFLLQNGVIKALFDLSRFLSEAFEVWPSDLETKLALAAGYSDVMRKKLWDGSDSLPIEVEVIGSFEFALSGLKIKLLQELNRPLLNTNISVMAFRDENPCSHIVRQAFAVYATRMLQDDIEPALYPVIAERVNRLLDGHATRLAERQAPKTEATTTAPTATSGAEPAGKSAVFMDDSGLTIGVAPEDTEGRSQSIGATA